MAKNKLSSVLSPSTAMPAPGYDKVYKPTARELAERRRYEVEDALRTLTRACEIEKDTKLMAEVKAMARTKAKEMQSVAGRRRAA